MEAAASGLPIVATNIRGCRQVVEDEINGLLVPVRDSAALASALKRLGNDPATREKMGIASSARARALFDERRVVQIVLDTYRRAARRKGLSWLLPPGGDVVIRSAIPSDAPTLAELHRRAISSGFLSSLGPRFLRLLYKAMIADPGSGVFVAEQDLTVVGFVAGTADTSQFYRRFARQHLVDAAFAMFPHLLRPTAVRRILETARHGSEEAHSVAAELLSMAVAPALKRQGVGQRLGSVLLEWAEGRQIPAMKVVVGANNAPAVGTYRKLGFSDPHRIEVHKGESSLELTWHR
jgi:ribosomal protein S18 acetylase RimI-like enzyme